jgi:hypothetical protein
VWKRRVFGLPVAKSFHIFFSLEESMLQRIRKMRELLNSLSPMQETGLPPGAALLKGLKKDACMMSTWCCTGKHARTEGILAARLPKLLNTIILEPSSIQELNYNKKLWIKMESDLLYLKILDNAQPHLSL